MRKLKVTWTLELYQDLLNYHGIDAMRRKYFWENDPKRSLIKTESFESGDTLLKKPLKCNLIYPVRIIREEIVGSHVDVSRIFFCKYEKARVLTEDVFALDYNIWKYNHVNGEDAFRFFEFREHINHNNVIYVGFLLLI